MKLILFATMAVLFLACNTGGNPDANNPNDKDNSSDEERRQVRGIDGLGAGDSDAPDCPDAYMDIVDRIFDKIELAREYYAEFTQGSSLYTYGLVSKTFTNVFDVNLTYERTYKDDKNNKIISCVGIVGNDEALIHTSIFAQRNKNLVSAYKKEMQRCVNNRIKCLTDKKLYNSL